MNVIVFAEVKIGRVFINLKINAILIERCVRLPLLAANDITQHATR